jgi:Recombination endonuclease VII
MATVKDFRTHVPDPKRKSQRHNPIWGTPVPAVNGRGESEHFCRGCQRTLPVTDFYRRTDKRAGHQSRCRECMKKKAIKHYYNNREHRKEVKRLWLACSVEQQREYEHLRSLRSYGYTQAQYEHKLAAQGGGCAICGRKQGTGPGEVKQARGGRFAVDHDHVTGQIRDLLCTPCNSALGSFQDDLDRMESAIIYILKWRERLGRQSG